MKHVKLAYNWVGPDGVVPNLINPTIGSLAAVAPKCVIEVAPRNEPHDQLHRRAVESQKQLGKKTNFSVSAAYYLEPEDTFVVPITLDYLRDFSGYFTTNQGVLDAGNFSHHTLDLIKNHNGYILIEKGFEAFIDGHQYASRMHNYFDSRNIPRNKVIYAVGAANAPEIYSEWCDEHNISENNRMKIVRYFPSMENFALDAYNRKLPEWPYDVNYVPEKKFLSLNWRHRQHRIILGTMFYHLDLLKDSYFSLSRFEPDGSREISADPMYLDWSGYTFADFEEFRDAALPLHIDNPNRWERDIIYDGGQEEQMFHYYQNSLVSVCTETTFYERPIACTEKSIKPIKYMHPFILVGAKGLLGYLKSLGFQTFDNWWDESYDQDDNYGRRMNSIGEICSEIAEWDDKKVKQFKKEVYPVLRHNYELLLSDPISGVYKDIYDYVAGGK